MINISGRHVNFFISWKTNLTENMLGVVGNEDLSFPDFGLKIIHKFSYYHGWSTILFSWIRVIIHLNKIMNFIMILKTKISFFKKSLFCTCVQVELSNDSRMYCAENGCYQGALGVCNVEPCPYEVRGWRNQDMPGNMTPSTLQRTVQLAIWLLSKVPKAKIATERKDFLLHFGGPARYYPRKLEDCLIWFQDPQPAWIHRPLCPWRESLYLN